jgi:hypothetical protein
MKSGVTGKHGVFRHAVGRPAPDNQDTRKRRGGEVVMLTRRATMGMVVAGVALIAALAFDSAQASADDARLTVTPAVYRTGNSSQSAQVQLVRHGWGGGYHGGWHGGYSGWGGYRGYGYGGSYRPYYRPYVGIGIGPVYSYGPGYGYGYGYGGYPAYGYGYRGCW